MEPSRGFCAADAVDDVAATTSLMQNQQYCMPLGVHALSPFLLRSGSQREA
jgi:hypothetical protein